MLGGANNTYSFEFRIKHMRHDAYEDEIDRARRRGAEYAVPKARRNPLQALRSNSTFKRGVEKAKTAAKTAEDEVELQSILNAPVHPFAVPEGGGTRKNGRRQSKTRRIGKKKTKK